MWKRMENKQKWNNPNMDRIKNIKIWKGTAKYLLIQRFIWREESQVKFLEKMQAGMTLKVFQVSLKKKGKKWDQHCNLQIQCNTNQNCKSIILKQRKNSPKIHMGLQKSPHRYSNPEKYKILLEKSSYLVPSLLQSQSNKKLGALA